MMRKIALIGNPNTGKTSLFNHLTGLRQHVGNYPGITLISVTQKIASVEGYDQIILLMEGEVLASGTHSELMASSPEYVQIYESQRSTSHYELSAH